MRPCKRACILACVSSPCLPPIPKDPGTKSARPGLHRRPDVGGRRSNRQHAGARRPSCGERTVPVTHARTPRRLQACFARATGASALRYFHRVRLRYTRTSRTFCSTCRSAAYGGFAESLAWRRMCLFLIFLSSPSIYVSVRHHVTGTCAQTHMHGRSVVRATRCEHMLQLSLYATSQSACTGMPCSQCTPYKIFSAASCARCMLARRHMYLMGTRMSRASATGCLLSCLLAADGAVDTVPRCGAKCAANAQGQNSSCRSYQPGVLRLALSAEHRTRCCQYVCLAFLCIAPALDAAFGTPCGRHSLPHQARMHSHVSCTGSVVVNAQQASP